MRQLAGQRAAGYGIDPCCRHWYISAAGDGLNLVVEHARLAREQADKLAMGNGVTHRELATFELSLSFSTTHAPLLRCPTPYQYPAAI
ncbi:MAG: hypothetical protein HOI95_22055 [Chromatiales bacterium]|nr:hypothetical protein [Chromatiales bacterium]